MPDSNYNFVIDSSFKPFSFQEVLTPLMMYKEAYEKSEAAYEDLSNKSDKFKLLAKNLPEGSEAKKIYDSYSQELQKQAQDLATNGLSMNNRMALTNLRRRYQGEIGMLLDADTEAKQRNALITQQRLKDPSMLFATPKVTIDDIVGGKDINDYAISGNELYTRGQQLGKAYSSRKVSDVEGGKTLGDLYRTWISTVGYTPETLEKFRQDASTLPEVQEAIADIMNEKRIKENLSPEDAEAAAQGILNGFLDGAIYSQKITPMRDENALSTKDTIALAQNGMSIDAKGNLSYDENKDIELQKRKAWKAADVLNTGVNNVNNWEKKEAHTQELKIKAALANREQMLKRFDDSFRGITNVGDLIGKIKNDATHSVDKNFNVNNEILTIDTAGGPVRVQVKGYIECREGEEPIVRRRGDTSDWTDIGSYFRGNDLYESNTFSHSSYKLTNNDDLNMDVPLYPVNEKDTMTLMMNSAIANAVGSLRSYDDNDHPFQLIKMPYTKSNADSYYYLVLEAIDALPYEKDGVSPSEIQAIDDAMEKQAIEAARKAKQ